MEKTENIVKMHTSLKKVHLLIFSYFVEFWNSSHSHYIAILKLNRKMYNKAYQWNVLNLKLFSSIHDLSLLSISIASSIISGVQFHLLRSVLIARRNNQHKYYKLISDSKHFTCGPHYTYLPFNFKMAI